MYAWIYMKWIGMFFHLFFHWRLIHFHMKLCVRMCIFVLSACRLPTAGWNENNARNWIHVRAVHLHSKVLVQLCAWPYCFKSISSCSSSKENKIHAVQSIIECMIMLSRYIFFCISLFEYSLVSLFAHTYSVFRLISSNSAIY